MKSVRRRRGSLIVAAAMVGLGASSRVLALDTWTNATGNGSWSTPSNWADGTIPTSGESVFFPFPGPANPNISVQISNSLTSLQFDNGYQIDGIMMPVPAIGVAGGKTATINAAINASTEFNKNGAGTLVLGGTNSLSSYININAGTLRVASDNNISQSNPTMRLYGTLEIAGTFSTTKYINQYGGTIKVLAGQTLTLPNNGQLDGGINNNNAALTKDGDGTLVLGGSHSRIGTTLINGGTLRLEQNAQPGYGAITVASGATLELNNKSYLYPSVNVGSGSTVRALGNVTTGITLPSGGSDVFPTVATGTSASDLFNATFSGTATSGSVINISGAGTVIPYPPSYLGTFAVNGATLRTGGSLGSGTSPIEVNSGGTVQFQTITSRPFNLNDGSAARIMGSQQPPVMNVAAGATVSLGTVQASDMMQITASNRLLGGSSASMITVDGPGVVSMGGSQPYAGGWTINSGTLRVSAGNPALGSGTSAIVMNGGTFELAGAVVSRDIAFNGGAIRGSTGSNTLLGMLTLTSGANVSLAGVTLNNGTNKLTGGGPSTYIHINSSPIPGNNVFLQHASDVVADWLVDGGGLYVSSDAQLGAPGNKVTLNPFGGMNVSGSVAFARNLTSNGGLIVIDSAVSWQNVAGSGLTKQNSGTMTVDSFQLGSLTVNGGAIKVAHTPASSATSEVSTLTIFPSARVDLTNSAMVFRGPASSWDGSQYTGVMGLVAKGRNGGTWDGVGAIVTSEPDALTGLTALVAMTASEAGISGTFRGVSVGPLDTIVAYTWGGDANLDGELNGDDYFAIDSHVLQSGSVFGYNNGDFDYDGDIDGDDYFVIDSNILQAQGSTPFPTGVGLAAVPEPAALGLLSTLFLLQRRRRS